MLQLISARYIRQRIKIEYVVKFLVVKKRALWAILACGILLCLAVGGGFLVKASLASPKPEYTIVIDAGHGGIDGGSVGRITGKDESFLNLEYAKSLKARLEEYNINVVMTRENLNGLYDLFASNKKKSDMARRKEIILSSHADMVVSIHMNSFPRASSRGAQVFYRPDDPASKLFADSIQEVFVKELPKARRTSQKGDYFILNCSNVPSVIVECGFLSNVEEEALLVTEEYREKVTEAIFVGIINYLGKL